MSDGLDKKETDMDIMPHSYTVIGKTQLKNLCTYPPITNKLRYHNYAESESEEGTASVREYKITYI